MDHTEAQSFAEQWARDWNAHDLEALFRHFTDDIVFTSPVAVRLLGGDGVIRGKEALRAYWFEGLRLIPDWPPCGPVVADAKAGTVPAAAMSSPPPAVARAMVVAASARRKRDINGSLCSGVTPAG